MSYDVTCCAESYELDRVRMQLAADIHVFTEANKVMI